jgi:hypothetical protein
VDHKYLNKFYKLSGFKKPLNEDTGKSILERVKDIIWNASNLEDIMSAIKLQYGNTIPLYHATTPEIAKIIDKEGLKQVNGRNAKHWGEQSNLYLQIGKSDYVNGDERPILYRYDASIDFIMSHCNADMDNISYSNQEISKIIGRDITNRDVVEDVDTEEFIIAFVYNNNKLEGLELLLISENLPEMKVTRVN